MTRTPTPRRRTRPPDLEAVREHLSSALPPLMQNAAASYQAFAALEPPQDARGFAAHHAACKAALAHLDLLAKLARWAAGKDEPAAAGDGDDLSSLLAEARAALADMAEDDEA